MPRLHTSFWRLHAGRSVPGGQAQRLGHRRFAQSHPSTTDRRMELQIRGCTAGVARWLTSNLWRELKAICASARSSRSGLSLERAAVIWGGVSLTTRLCRAAHAHRGHLGQARHCKRQAIAVACAAWSSQHPQAVVDWPKQQLKTLLKDQALRCKGVMTAAPIKAKK